MLYNKKAAGSTVVEAARALIAAYEAGIIAIPAYVPTWQCEQIARELRIGTALLQTVSDADALTTALDLLTNIRHGLAQGTLAVTRDDAAAHVQATLRIARSELCGLPEATAALCFDAPAPGALTAV
jgi:hypothetical protein